MACKERIDTLSLNDRLIWPLLFGKGMRKTLAGVLFLQYYLYNKLDWKLLISRFEEIFHNKYIYDWNVCDWFCVRRSDDKRKRHSLRKQFQVE